MNDPRRNGVSWGIEATEGEVVLIFNGDGEIGFYTTARFDPDIARQVAQELNEAADQAEEDE